MKIPRGRKNRTGPIIRTDVVDVQVFRVFDAPQHDLDAPPAAMRIADTDPRAAREALIQRTEFLQLLRSDGSLTNTWQPVMGHAHVGESAAACALRELEEEVAIRHSDKALLGLWALEQVHPFFLAHVDIIMFSPRFCARVATDWSPTLNHEHTDYRWVKAAEAARTFMWPGQIAAIQEIIDFILNDASLMRDRVRVV